MSSNNGKVLPASLKVKNTFIDIRSTYIDDPDETFEPPSESFHKRQFSEPAPSFQRQLSARIDQNALAVLAGGPVGLFEEDEDEDFDGPTSGTGWSQQQRQETVDLFNSMPLGRQVTEPNWPTWGLQAPPLVPDVYAPDIDPASMWLFGFGGNQQAQAELAALAGAANLDMPPLGQQDLIVDIARGSAMGNWSAANLQSGATASPKAPPPPLVTSAAPLTGMSEPPPEWSSTVTVMMRNLPNKYNQQMLLEELNASGFLGTFDFLYLPIDPETNANRGYSFINFTDPSFAWMLKLTYEGRKMGRFNSDKVVSVAPAALQGFEANYAHYSTARVNRGDPTTRPLFLRESSMPHVKPEGGRRRGGRRSQGSLIDLAARQQQRVSQVTTAPGPVASYIGLKGPSPPGAVDAISGGMKGQPAVELGYSAGKGKKAGEPPKLPKSSSAGDQVFGQMKPKFCPYCGGEVQATFRFCQFCGQGLAFGGEKTT